MQRSLRPGTLVNDNVRLLSPLGAGGMGAVWVAEHLTLGTQVAVKFILEQTSHPSLLSRFTLEASAAAQIKSPHVVRVLDHGLMADGVPYIIMELLEGDLLAERLERLGWLSLAECAHVVRHIARALTGAHQLGIVHRDVKPENIFLCHTDDDAPDDPAFCKLLDFGVAKQRRSLHGGGTMAGTLVGTAEYMSREQVLSASHVDWRADLWALSVVAYEMLVGDVPFIGDNVGAVCVAICAGTYARPSTLRHELGPEVDAWFAKAFHADPAQRHQSARELAQSLKTVLLGELSIDEELSGELSLPPSISEPHVVIEMDPDAAAARSSEPPSDIPIRTSRRRSAALTLGAVALAALAVMTLLRTPEPDRLDRMALVVPTIVVEPAASTSSAAGPAASEGVGEDDVPSPTRAAAPRPSPSSRTVAHPSASSPSSPQPPPPDRENHHADELRNDYGF